MIKLKIVLTIMIIGQTLHAGCTTSKRYWQNQIQKSKVLEKFFINNYECQQDFYRALDNSQKIYFDTIIYPKGLNKKQYTNRWLAMLLENDGDFFKRFPFFNNYFAIHKNNITTRQLQCFQRQRGFPQAVAKSKFYNEINRRGMSNDVNYLYPLIRWSYLNSGIDMSLSAKRVEIAQKIFGITKSKIGDNEQFARYIALFDMEYNYVSNYLAKNLNIPSIEAYKLLVILTYLESRGNVFALSSTGAFGPLQITMHYYMMYGQPNNPFNPKSSLIKLANKFIYYNKIGKSLDTSVIAYKSGSLQKCQDNLNINDVDCKYYHDYKQYLYGMRGINRKSEISRYLTGKSYRYPALNRINRARNMYSAKQYEPYQYAVLKGDILLRGARDSLYMDGTHFKSLGQMKRSDIYKLQHRYGANQIDVVSDKKVCY
ncbi:MAG TPA: hypothetical protein ENK88_03215 [Campylobacterales bacterium]|nr:hypothetical protein [Campylobacterales bacterium]HHD80317.1 hypothetical protein [Campylobacterales bacterium]